MKRLLVLFSILALVLSAQGQKLPVAWDELTSPDFIKAVKQSNGVCVIPLGVIEKHGPHLPLGTDVFSARSNALLAAGNEYCIVYPYYFAGQIYEAKHQPGTITYSPDILYKLLDETCKEISRNGLKKIILYNGHGGNTNFLQYFCQAQLAEQKDYVVYLYSPETDVEARKQIDAMLINKAGEHAHEEETSEMMIVRPDLVKIDQAITQSGADLNRLSLKDGYTGIWWYAKYPNHYAGDAKDANSATGKVVQAHYVKQLTEFIKTVKADTDAQPLQNEFYKESASPLNTKVKN